MPPHHISTLFPYTTLFRSAKVNLIPYNTVEGLSWRRPSEMRQHVFYRALRKNGVDATIRREKGHDINAACGQLRLQVIRDKSLDRKSTRLNSSHANISYAV